LAFSVFLHDRRHYRQDAHAYARPAFAVRLINGERAVYEKEAIYLFMNLMKRVYTFSRPLQLLPVTNSAIAHHQKITTLYSKLSIVTVRIIIVIIIY